MPLPRVYNSAPHLENVSKFINRIVMVRAETKALIGGGGGVYSYIRVLPDEFLLKSVVITVDFKRNLSGRTRIYEYAPPPPINALVSSLVMVSKSL